MFEQNGNMEEIYEEKVIEWKTVNFFSIAADTYIKSPTFSFADSSWFFGMLPKIGRKPDYGVVALCSIISNKYLVKMDFGLKKLDNSVVELEEITYKRDGIPRKVFYFKRSEIEKLKSEVSSSDVLTFRCTIKFENALNKPKLEELIKLDKLSENFKDLMSNKESCDITLNVQDKEYRAHRAVMVARSSVFAAMFMHETLEKQNGIVTISDCDPGSFKEFLEFLYSGKFEKPSWRSALHLYVTSDKYDVQELKTFCVAYLMENFSVENVCDVVILADKYEEANLLSAAQDFFNRNIDKIVDTPEWDSLYENNNCLSKTLLKGMSSKVKVIE